MHHYTKITCGTQSLADMVPLLDHPMWEVDIPQAAFSSDLALNALLAISAWDLSCRTPNDKTLAISAKRYFDKAVARHRQEVARIDASNSPALLVAAVLIAHFTWLTSYPETNTQAAYDIFGHINTFHMCEGIRLLVDSTPHLQWYRWPPQVPPDRSRASVKHPKFLRGALQDIGALLENLKSVDRASEDFFAYERATQEIIDLYYLIANGEASTSEVEQLIVSILHRIPRRFVELLSQNDHLALALMARNVALLELVPNSRAWWLHGSGVSSVGVKGVSHVSAIQCIGVLASAMSPQTRPSVF